MDIVVNDVIISVIDGSNVLDAITVYNTQHPKYSGWRSILAYNEQNHPISLLGILSPGDKLKIILQ